MTGRIGRWTVARWLVAATMLALFVAARDGQLDWFRGTVTFTRTGGVLPLLDPLVALESGVVGIDRSVLWGAAILLLVAAVLGPVFCGWVCPLGLLLDGNDAVRRGLRRWLRGRAPRPDPVPSWPRARLAVLGAVLGAAWVAAVPVFLPLSPIRLTVEAVATGALSAMAVVATLIVVEWFLPRVWCRLLCPLGAVYSLVGRAARLRVRIDPIKAGHAPCGLCTRHCPMGIQVMQDHTLRGHAAVDDPACIRCGACIDHCPSGVLWLGFRGAAAAARRRPAVPADGVETCDLR